MVEHTYAGVTTGKTSFCDDPYCTGHNNKTVNCTCGWSEKSKSSDYDTEWKNQIAWLTHVVTELQTELKRADKRILNG